MTEFAKAALNTWCSRKKLKINYEVSDVSKYNVEVPIFHCEVSFDIHFLDSRSDLNFFVGFN